MIQKNFNCKIKPRLYGLVLLACLGITHDSLGSASSVASVLQLIQTINNNTSDVKGGPTLTSLGSLSLTQLQAALTAASVSLSQVQAVGKASGNDTFSFDFAGDIGFAFPKTTWPVAALPNLYSTLGAITGFDRSKGVTYVMLAFDSAGNFVANLNTSTIANLNFRLFPYDAQGNLLVPQGIAVPVSMGNIYNNSTTIANNTLLLEANDKVLNTAAGKPAVYPAAISILPASSKGLSLSSIQGMTTYAAVAQAFQAAGAPITQQQGSAKLDGTDNFSFSFGNAIQFAMPTTTWQNKADTDLYAQLKAVTGFNLSSGFTVLMVAVDSNGALVTNVNQKSIANLEFYLFAYSSSGTSLFPNGQKIPKSQGNIVNNAAVIGSNTLFTYLNDQGLGTKTYPASLTLAPAAQPFSLSAMQALGTFAELQQALQVAGAPITLQQGPAKLDGTDTFSFSFGNSVQFAIPKTTWAKTADANLYTQLKAVSGFNLSSGFTVVVLAFDANNNLIKNIDNQSLTGVNFYLFAYGASGAALFTTAQAMPISTQGNIVNNATVVGSNTLFTFLNDQGLGTKTYPASLSLTSASPQGVSLSQVQAMGTYAGVTQALQTAGAPVTQVTGDAKLDGTDTFSFSFANSLAFAFPSTTWAHVADSDLYTQLQAVAGYDLSSGVNLMMLAFDQNNNLVTNLSKQSLSNLNFYLFAYSPSGTSLLPNGQPIPIATEGNVLNNSTVIPNNTLFTYLNDKGLGTDNYPVVLSLTSSSNSGSQKQTSGSQTSITQSALYTSLQNANMTITTYAAAIPATTLPSWNVSINDATTYSFVNQGSAVQPSQNPIALGEILSSVTQAQMNAGITTLMLALDATGKIIADITKTAPASWALYMFDSTGAALANTPVAVPSNQSPVGVYAGLDISYIFNQNITATSVYPFAVTFITNQSQMSTQPIYLAANLESCNASFSTTVAGTQGAAPVASSVMLRMSLKDVGIINKGVMGTAGTPMTVAYAFTQDTATPTVCDGAIQIAQPTSVGGSIQNVSMGGRTYAPLNDFTSGQPCPFPGTTFSSVFECYYQVTGQSLVNIKNCPYVAGQPSIVFMPA